MLDCRDNLRELRELALDLPTKTGHIVTSSFSPHGLQEAKRLAESLLEEIDRRCRRLLALELPPTEPGVDRPAWEWDFKEALGSVWKACERLVSETSDLTPIRPHGPPNYEQDPEFYEAQQRSTRAHTDGQARLNEALEALSKLERYIDWTARRQQKLGSRHESQAAARATTPPEQVPQPPPEPPLSVREEPATTPLTQQPMSSTDTADRLVQTIDDLLAAAHFSICTPCTEQSYASLVQLHGTVKGLAAVLGIGSPPALEDAALAVHQRTLAGPFVPVRGINYSPPAAWERQMLSLRAAAEAVRSVEWASVRGEQPATDDGTADSSGAEEDADNDPHTGVGEKWMPASEALEVAEEKGYGITLDWISKRKRRIRTRPRQLPGNHKLEVEMSSFGAVLFAEAKRKTVKTDTDEPGVTERSQIEARKREAQESKRPRLW